MFSRNRTKIVIVGLGRVGFPLFEIINGVYKYVYGIDVRTYAGKKLKTCDVMHICLRYSDNFESIVIQYVKEFRPKLLLIESTVPVGTSRTLYQKGPKMLVAHSPVRGRVSEGMKHCLLKFTKFVGPVTTEAGELAKRYYTSLGFKVTVMNNSETTELAKLVNTTYYGLMITFWQEVARMCDQFQAPIDELRHFALNTDAEGGLPYKRFIPKPPLYIDNKSCIIPNAEILAEQFESKFVRALLKSNTLRKIEIGAV